MFCFYYLFINCLINTVQDRGNFTQPCKLLMFFFFRASETGPDAGLAHWSGQPKFKILPDTQQALECLWLFH